LGFWAQALVFLRSRHWCFLGAGIGVFVVAAFREIDSQIMIAPAGRPRRGRRDLESAGD
jgi:hypothetical protein